MTQTTTVIYITGLIVPNFISRPSFSRRLVLNVPAEPSQQGARLPVESTSDASCRMASMARDRLNQHLITYEKQRIPKDSRSMSNRRLAAALAADKEQVVGTRSRLVSAANPRA